MELAETMMSPERPWKDWRNMRSQPPMTEMTTSTMAVQMVTAISDTQAMRRLRRYLRMRRSLYKGAVARCGLGAADCQLSRCGSKKVHLLREHERIFEAQIDYL